MAGMDPLYASWICQGCVDALNNRKHKSDHKPDPDSGLFTATAQCWRCGATTKCALNNQVYYPNQSRW
jgi:hypothetical protein